MSASGPYLGLRAYQPDDAPLFFGRDAEIRDVRSLWLSSRLLVLFGRSGVGKSSLLQAGVLPALAGAEADVLPVGRVVAPGTTGLAGRNRFTAALLATWGVGLSGQTVTTVLGRPSPPHGEFGQPTAVLAAIDQFEDVFSEFAGARDEREDFITDLATALRDNRDLNLLITVRDDFLAAVLSVEERLVSTARRRYRLLALEPAAARDAVARPVQGTGRTFGPGAVAYLVDALGTDRAIDARRGSGAGGGDTSTRTDHLVEPVQLQLVCERMWNALPAGLSEITVADVARYGNVDRTLSDFYDEAVTEVSGRFQVRQVDLRAWIEKVFITETGTRDMAYEGASTTAGMPNEVPAALADRFILRAEMREGFRWYELAHDRLIAPILRSNRTFTEETSRAGASPWAAVRRLQAAENALVGGLLDEAERWAREAYGEVDDARMRAEANLLRGRIAAQRESAGQAETLYRQAAEAFERLGDRLAVGRVYARLGEAYLADRQYHSAITFYDRALERVHGDPEVQLGFAIALWHSEQRVAASAVVSQILTVDPGYAPALSVRGQLLAELGDGEAALVDLDRAIKIGTDPQQRAALHAARALALAHLGRADEASEEIATARDLRAAGGITDSMLDLRAAQVAAARGDTARAAQLAAAALHAEPPLSPVHDKDARLLASEPGPAHEVP